MTGGGSSKSLGIRRANPNMRFGWGEQKTLRGGAEKWRRLAEKDQVRARKSHLITPGSLSTKNVPGYGKTPKAFPYFRDPPSFLRASALGFPRESVKTRF